MPKEKVDMKTGEIVKVRRIETAAIVPGTSIWDRDLCAHAKMVALDLSSSELVPELYRNSPPNCFVAMHRSNALGVDVMTFMEQTFYVHRTLGMFAKFAIGLANAAGVFDGGIQWELSGAGDTRQAKAWAKRTGGGEYCESTVTIDMAKSEGWYKNNPKWQSIPDLMLQYRSAMWLIRLYCPEVVLGMSSVEELRDIEDSTPPPPLVEGPMDFGKKGQAALEAPVAPDVVDVQVPDPPTAAPEAPEKAGLPEVPPEQRARAPVPGEGFGPGQMIPHVGQYVQNGPRGQVVKVTNIDPPECVTADGRIVGKKQWPAKMQAWVPKGDEMVPEGFFAPVIFDEPEEIPEDAESSDPGSAPEEPPQPPPTAPVEPEPGQDSPAPPPDEPDVDPIDDMADWT